MAKCLIHKVTKQPVRVSDEEAERKVRSGDWSYTNKSNYKRILGLKDKDTVSESAS